MESRHAWNLVEFRTGAEYSGGVLLHEPTAPAPCACQAPTAIRTMASLLRAAVSATLLVSAKAWFATGHEIVGAIAARHLTPKTAAAVTALLGVLTATAAKSRFPPLRRSPRCNRDFYARSSAPGGASGVWSESMSPRLFRPSIVLCLEQSPPLTPALAGQPLAGVVYPLESGVDTVTAWADSIKGAPSVRRRTTRRLRRALAQAPRRLTINTRGGALAPRMPRCALQRRRTSRAAQSEPQRRRRATRPHAHTRSRPAPGSTSVYSTWHYLDLPITLPGERGRARIAFAAADNARAAALQARCSAPGRCPRPRAAPTTPPTT